ncbi:hypothetical protein [Tsuneonella sp. SYSU-LHT278]|uniref:hypothetical protein n=1 Tax=Tsuneonella sediminis TaxID=3416089 RepID=UPI003F791E34
MPTDCASPLRAPLGTAGRLREALCALAGGQATVVRQTERPWASITFEGARHGFELTFDGIEAVGAGERFVEALPDHEFAIPGQLVAEAAIVAVDHRLLPGPRMTVSCELLLLRDV